MLGSETQQESLSKKERKKLLVSQLKDLTSEIVTDEEKLRMFADRWRSGFHNYSLSNLFLIWSQCPEFSLVAGFNQWKRVGRYVKKGSKAIWILAPMVSSKYVLKKIVSDDTSEDDEPEVKDEYEKKVITGFIPVHVFDYSQTDGDDLDIGNTLVKGSDSLTVDLLSSEFDVPVEYSQGVQDGYTNGKKIVLSRRKNKAQEVACYLHEIAHVLLGHPEEKDDKVTPRDERELQAESVAYIVGACIGLDNQGAKYYLGHWNGTKEKVKEHSIKIISVADKILRKVYPLLEKVEVSQKMKGQAVLF